MSIQHELDPLRPSQEAALAAWARRVQANREQVEQFREVGDEADFYAPLASRFRADPTRQDDPVVAVLRSLVRPGEAVLDVGAGGGRYALPLALRLAREVVALDPSAGMLAILRESMAEHGIANVRTVEARWPAPELGVRCDVALIAHVGYDIEEIGPFLDALEHAAGRLCVAVLLERQPTFALDALWPEIHGVPRATLPSLREFLAVLLARGRLCEVRLTERTPMSYERPEDAQALAHRQLWVQPGGEKERRLRALLAQRLQARNGRYALSWEPLAVGVVSWTPGVR